VVGKLILFGVHLPNPAGELAIRAGSEDYQAHSINNLGALPVGVDAALDLHEVAENCEKIMPARRLSGCSGSHLSGN